MFDSITGEMISGLDATNLKRFSDIRRSIEQEELNSSHVILCFSDLAFSLAQKSVRSGVNVAIARPLWEIFDKYLNSHMADANVKVKMKSLIGETKLDFLYASGERNISSLRLAPYLIAKNEQGK